MKTALRTEPTACPFMDLDDHRCASRFSLSRLNEAFGICMNRYLACPTYYRLLREHNGVTPITINGQPVARRPLRPTGT